jgi:predicted nuclease of predicted toxin-antitoxin system
MKFTQIKILTDENISPKVVTFLREVGIDVRDVKEELWHGRPDEQLLQIAYQEDRFVLTHDADFGALAIYQENACYGILYLRLRNVRPATIIQILAGLIQKDVEVTPFTIWVIEEKRVRIRQIAM